MVAAASHHFSFRSFCKQTFLFAFRFETEPEALGPSTAERMAGGKKFEFCGFCHGFLGVCASFSMIFLFLKIFLKLFSSVSRLYKRFVSSVLFVRLF